MAESLGVLSSAMRLTLWSCIVVALVLWIPGFTPDISFESYTLKPPIKFEPNNILDKAEVFVSGGLVQSPDSIAIRGDTIYTGVVGGNILKITKDKEISVVANTGGECGGEMGSEGLKCGRPVGMKFGPDGNLYIADAHLGIFRVNVDTGALVQLISVQDKIDGKRPMFPDDIEIGSDGLVYWTDASTVSTIKRMLAEQLSSGTGRLIQSDPKTNVSKVLIDKLHFANGIQISPQKEFILVIEMMRMRIWKYHLSGNRQGESEVFVDGLPGLPDGIRPNRRGGYYVSLIVPRSAELPILGELPMVRKFVVRITTLIDFLLLTAAEYLPQFLQLQDLAGYVSHLGPIGDPTKFPKTCTVVEISATGAILKVLQTQNSEMSLITEMSTGDEHAYFGTFLYPKLWRINTKFLDP